ncbi:hypothetical protein [Streptomyces formicae]|uniref:Tetratricopeptide repeat family protein n=1 Tax=Streptomyces formicae TaxID=1616117 RepID=A0A291QKM3_9ACTN|nr:hypothetical protein [Streptomyces formicae]ATL32077.1 tetratricopeptide repeat family protein [Streptomyces formicae]
MRTYTRDDDVRRLLVASEGGDVRAMVLLAGWLVESGRPREAEPWARAAAEAGDSEGMDRLAQICVTMALGGTFAVDLEKLAELRKDPEFVGRAKRWSDEGRRWRVNAAEVGHEGAISLLAISATSDDERERWLRHGASMGHRRLRARLLELLREQRRFDEAEPWQRAEAEDGNGREQLKLAQHLSEQGCFDEAEHWYRTAADGDRDGTSLHAVREFVRFLTGRGRDDEAEHWRRRATEIEHHLAQKYGDFEGLPAFRVAGEEVVLTALVTTAVLPFIQTLVSKTAEDAYAQARQLIRRLPLMRGSDRGAGEPAGSSAGTGALFVVVDDPDAGVTLYLSSAVSDEALQALSSFDLAELTARRPDEGRIRLVWHQESGTWRIRGDTS